MANSLNLTCCLSKANLSCDKTKESPQHLDFRFRINPLLLKFLSFCNYRKPPSREGEAGLIGKLLESTRMQKLCTLSACKSLWKNARRPDCVINWKPLTSALNLTCELYCLRIGLKSEINKKSIFFIKWNKKEIIIIHINIKLKYN